ncbi:MAG: hypothetical protein ABI191_00760, partial [Rhizomicrobium sp.]
MSRETAFRGYAIALALGMTACAPKEPPAPQFHAVAETAAPLDTAPSDIAILNRVSWGAETSDAQLLKQQGLRRWLDGQLNPAADDGLPVDARNQIAAL